VRSSPDPFGLLPRVIASHRAHSPNAEEALSLLAYPSPVSKSSIERACKSFLDFGVGPAGTGAVIIRSGSLGAFVASREQPGVWIEAYWTNEERVVDVTGAGNSFLGGLAAGLVLTNGDVVEAARYGTISASYTVEQLGLPQITRASSDVRSEEWNGDSPWGRLQELKGRGTQVTKG